MAVDLDETALGGMRWVVVRGPGPKALAALGEHVRPDIAAVLDGLPGLARLRAHVAAEPAAGWLAAVRRATERDCPQAWAELTALAAGAGADRDDLALLNFRGDVGRVPPPPGAGHGSAGCSDLAWQRRRSFVAHNEDDSTVFTGRAMLLTLLLDGQPPITSYWKPGFLPSNALSVTGHGLVIAIDHLTVAAPGAGPGRHFVARDLQRSAVTAAGAAAYLRTHPSAGGFSYTLGDRSGHVLIAESAAGRYAELAVTADGPLAWHTNHGRYVTGADPDPGGTTVARGEVLGALPVPAAEPDAAWFARVLTAPPPRGVRADDDGGPDPTVTLATFVADLTADRLLILDRGRAPVTISLANLARGSLDNSGAEKDAS
jgi:hypothetical protein